MRLVFDMDNTLADFDGNGGVEKMYEKGFFRNLKPYANATETLKALNVVGFPLYVVSACIDSPHCKQEKLDWLDEHMPFIPKEHILLVPVGTDKAKAFADYTKAEITHTDILFDDYKENLKQWTKANGTAVKCGKVYKKDRNYKQVIKFSGVADVLATI